MAKFLVVFKPEGQSAQETELRSKLIDFTPAPGTAKEQGIEALKAAFGDVTGTFYYAPASAFGTIVASRSNEITYT